MVSDGGQAGPLDVVAELAAHQQNLEPRPAPGRAALVALPLPPLCAVLAGCLAGRRAREVAALAELLGGGDGPLPVVEPGAGGFGAALVRLWDGGVRALFAHGMGDQPGLARALRYRWPGALHEVGTGALDALHRSGEAAVWLADGVVRVAPGAPIPGGARRVLAAVDEGGDPRAVREQGAHVWPFAIDPERRLGVWSGALPPRGGLGTAEGARLRDLWREHWAGLGQPELVRLAVLGLDPGLEHALREGAARPAAEEEKEKEEKKEETAPVARRARIVAVTGIDGAGKSTQVDRLARRLRDRGAEVRVVKLYRQGAFLQLADELGARTRRGAPLAAFRVSRIVKLVDSLRVHRDHIAPALEACDALIMDRYVETHLAAAASQLGWDLSAHPALAPFPAADLRFWLELDPAVALARRHARGGSPSADEHPVGLRGYARELARLASSSADVRLDAAAPEEDNAWAIAARTLPLVLRPIDGDGDGDGDGERERGGRARAGHACLVAPGAPPPAPPAGRCALHLGPGRGEPVVLGSVVLGSDVASLRAALRGWCGGVADGVPESFWLEAYAAQLLLDLRILAPARASAALWPGALARMPGHRDLPVLDELAAMLAAEVEVTAYQPAAGPHAAAFAELGASPVASARLARDYAIALGELALESGWSAAASR